MATAPAGSEPSLVPLAEIERAAARLVPILPPTPVVTFQGTDPLVHGRVLAKLETANLTHSFKIRGALNTMLTMQGTLPPHGVVTSSAGNHGLAVSKAAQLLDVPATVVLPAGATRTKVAGIEALGARTIFVEGDYGLAEAKARELAQQQNMFFLSPYDEPLVMAGAGTIGLELARQVPHLARVVVPVGGAGLISGLGSALAHVRPSVEVVAVQTDASPVLHTIFHGGDGTKAVLKRSMADGLTGHVDPSSRTVPILRRVARRFLLVPEERIAPAVARVAQQERLLIEGATATAPAALYEGMLGPPPPGDTVLLLSGANIDLERWWACVQAWTP